MTPSRVSFPFPMGAEIYFQKEDHDKTEAQPALRQPVVDL